MALWLCLKFQKVSNSETWQGGRPTYTDVSQHVTMLTPPICHLKSIYGFIFAIKTPITTKFDRMVNQSALTSAYFRHLFRAVPTLSPLFKFIVVFFFTPKILSCMLFRGVSSLSCPKFIKICTFLVIPHACPAFLKNVLLTSDLFSCKVRLL